MKLKIFIKVIPLMLLLFFSITSFALTSQSGNKTVKAIEIDTRFNPTQVQLYVNESIENYEGCRNTHRYAFSYDEKGKALYSLLLVAKTTGSSIQINTDGCQDSVPKIKIIRMN